MKISVVSESEFTVQGHGVHTAYAELTAALKKRTDADVVVNAKGPADITHIHTVGAYALKRLLFDTSKKVVSAHIVPASLVGSLVGAGLWLPLAKLYLRWFYNRADIVFAVSDQTKRELVELGVTKPIEVVYNMIDISRYRNSPETKAAARQQLGMGVDDWVVVGAGQVQPRKRVDEFVTVAERLPGIQFIWVGGMPFGKLAADNKHMTSLMSNTSRNIAFTGVVEHDLVKTYYQAADAFWLPSEQETFGLVVVEAAASGLPIVLRDIADYDETFKGQALMARDAEDVVTILERLKLNRDVYDTACRRSYEGIAKRFDSIVGAQKVMNIYRKLLSDK